MSLWITWIWFVIKHSWIRQYELFLSLLRGRFWSSDFDASLSAGGLNDTISLYPKSETCHDVQWGTEVFDYAHLMCRGRVGWSPSEWKPGQELQETTNCELIIKRQSNPIICISRYCVSMQIPDLLTLCKWRNCNIGIVSNTYSPHCVCSRGLPLLLQGLPHPPCPLGVKRVSALSGWPSMQSAPCTWRTSRWMHTPVLWSSEVVSQPRVFESRAQWREKNHSKQTKLIVLRRYWLPFALQNCLHNKLLRATIVCNERYAVRSWKNTHVFNPAAA